MKIKFKESLYSYIKYILFSYVIIASLRLVEMVLISFYYRCNGELGLSESFGLLYDVLICNVIALCCFPLFIVGFSLNRKIKRIIFYLLSFTGIIISFSILRYFLYQLTPLDIFIYKYSFNEILFTLQTSETNTISNLVIISILFVIGIISLNFLRKRNIPLKIQKFILIVILASLPLLFLLHSVCNLNKFSKNKTIYFITKSYKYFNSEQKNIDSDVTHCRKIFQGLYPSKQFLDPQYPLLYKTQQNNLLNSYFEKFDRAPNVVILIVEGLNDDFIHNYKGVMLMPFLNKLKDESLYWNKCFTLGERSFAAVPSILGGLPYGVKGFTLLDTLPKHVSLVSILHANNYYTSFYYGQGSWFHMKDRFFRYNNIDLIVDNVKFSKKYSKIIVGNDNFFWGYNDKDLFNQSFEVIDTLHKSKRLDIYFTGTSHSPFAINEDAYYTSKLNALKQNENEDFFNTYKKYLKSILFVNDALQAFFEEYKKRDDYKNTIFIITGDHPMTELPIDNSLKRYHVPLIIYSEKLKQANTFTNVVSHLDISETILSFLQNYNVTIPNERTSLGDYLISNDNQNKHFACMNDNREIVDYYSNGYYLSENTLYKVDSKLGISEVYNESKKASILTELNTFKTINLYTCLSNKIISDEIYNNELHNSKSNSLKSKK